MARVVAFVPDLLFGSNVLGALRPADTTRCSSPTRRRCGVSLPARPGLVVDLTADPAERIEQVSVPPRVKTLAFYSHVETHVRAQAEQAGFDLVIPRSRMAREGATVLTRLLET